MGPSLFDGALFAIVIPSISGNLAIKLFDVAVGLLRAGIGQGG